jgi:hypothetical protein
MVDAMYRVCTEARYIPSRFIVFDQMYRAWQGMYRAWNVWVGTSFVNPGVNALLLGQQVCSLPWKGGRSSVKDRFLSAQYYVSLLAFCCGHIFQSDVVYGIIRVSLLAIFRDSTFNSPRPSWFGQQFFFKFVGPY